MWSIKSDWDIPTTFATSAYSPTMVCTRRCYAAQQIGEPFESAVERFGTV